MRGATYDAIEEMGTQVKHSFETGSVHPDKAASVAKHCKRAQKP